ncbi:ATP-binding protein [Dyadobacter sp. LHD-138]|uniref:hybrid sensor histidine kinase/response regulator transcription factor n=1 Tax=Dyadobacter sp. LHD-138 TaxID=3071413 RepID=UPI0027DF00CA|nr:ATP-binding protein [Dyadobacter sp. LHD-138]MDQ6477282.1 ATP-binding protein [Dyadobacter sp. LHD-138]
MLCTLAKAQPGAVERSSARRSAVRPYVAWVKHDGPENGLAHREVNAIFQDRQGFMWFGTKFGLSRFDGKTFTNFTKDRNGLVFDDIQSITQDADGLLWLLGPYGESRIFLFNPLTGTTIPFEKKFGKKHTVSYLDFPKRLLGSTDGTIFFTNYHQAILSSYHPKSGLNYVRLSRFKERTIHQITIRNTIWAIADGRILQEFKHSQDLFASCLGQRNAGTYQLLIRAQAGNGQRSANMLTIEVNVRRPFYLQTWFVVLAILLLFVGIWGWFKWRIWNHQHEQLRLEAEIRRATARIEHDKEVIERQAKSLHQLNEAKSRFFANISHEFRTPLTVILGMTSELKRFGPHEVVERSRRVADLIERNGSSLLRLINQILDLSKLESGAMSWQPIRADLVRFARYVAESFDTMAAAKDIQMHFRSDERDLEADFDKDKLQDILSNLLTNAIKFTPIGGQVCLRLATVPTANDNGHRENAGSFRNEGYYEAVSPVQSTDGEWISIYVRNTGPGIEADKLPLIFDRFFQVSGQPASETGGTGIGLALVRELVSLMQGRLSVQSVPGEGAEFVVGFRRTRHAPFVLLPQTEPIPGIPDMPEATAVRSEAAEEKPVLLLVEDNEDVSAYIVSSLNTDYHIIRADNGQAGIDLALENIPDMILTDVMMPLKDGYELCDTLKNASATSHIPIVMLTARAGAGDRITGLRRGADAYLTKPFQREELEVVLNNLLQSRRRLQAYYSRQVMGSSESDLAPVEENESLENLFLQRLRSALEEHCGNNPASMETICQQIGMSRSSLHRKMIALTGMSVTRYDRTLRLTQARQLLTTTPKSISEVAYAVGFEDPKYFSRLFSEEFDVSPTEFRRLKQ